MALLQTNATVAVRRRTGDAFSNQRGDPAQVAGLEAVPVYVRETAQTPRPADVGADYVAQILWDPRHDIRDGDYLLGYVPAGRPLSSPTVGSAQPPTLQVQHVASSGAGTPLECRSATTIAARFLPDVCTVLRMGGGSYAYAGALASAQTVATRVPCLVVPQPMEEYPFAAIPNQPQTRWQVDLLPPAGTDTLDIRNNDILSLDGGQRLYVVLRSESPRSYALTTTTHCVLAALGGQLGDAYLRPNATALSTRAGWQVYGERRVHLAFAQANPQSALERITGGVATLRIAIFDLVDADFQQGDAVQILSEDGASVLPGVDTFTLAGVLRRPLPFAICEMDAIADILG